MDGKQRALELFTGGYNCSQSVFCVWSKENGLSEESALKISCGFGGGMRDGEVCGAVSGALMAIGLKYGQSVEDDVETKEHCYRLIKEFTAEFKQKHKTLICRELLGHDPSTEDGARIIDKEGLSEKLCPEFIKSAVEILEKML